MRRILKPGDVWGAGVPCMADDASAFSAFRKLKIRDGVMDVVYTDGLNRIMEVVPGFSQVQMRVVQALRQRRRARSGHSSNSSPESRQKLNVWV